MLRTNDTGDVVDKLIIQRRYIGRQKDTVELMRKKEAISIPKPVPPVY